MEETDYFVSAAEKAVDLEAFAEDIWPKLKLNDELKEKLIAIFTEQFGQFMPEFIERELQLPIRRHGSTLLSAADQRGCNSAH